MADVVRTRMYVTDRGNIAAVAAAHGEVFGDIRPASTAIVVEALIEPSLLVEIEAEARRSSG
jgi:enamine deaminase RidA (YjgF/YER057c/UK114 family)